MFLPIQFMGVEGEQSSPKTPITQLLHLSSSKHFKYHSLTKEKSIFIYVYGSSRQEIGFIPMTTQAKKVEIHTTEKRARFQLQTAWQDTKQLRSNKTQVCPNSVVCKGGGKCRCKLTGLSDENISPFDGPSLVHIHSTHQGEKHLGLFRCLDVHRINHVHPVASVK